MKALRLLSLITLTVSLATVSNVFAEGDAAKGKKAAAACAACHGPAGNSLMSQNPKLAGQGAKYIAKQLEDFKEGHRKNPIMQGQAKGLSPETMENIGAYFAEQTSSIGQADPEFVEQGARIYRGGNANTGVTACAACHGATGEGVDAAGFPALGGQHAAYIEAQLKAFRAAGREDLGRATKRTNDGENTPDAPPGMMQMIAAKMSDKEIRAVASFISGLHQ